MVNSIIKPPTEGINSFVETQTGVTYIPIGDQAYLTQNWTKNVLEEKQYNRVKTIFSELSTLLSDSQLSQIVDKDMLKLFKKAKKLSINCGRFAKGKKHFKRLNEAKKILKSSINEEKKKNAIAIIKSVCNEIVSKK